MPWEKSFDVDEIVDKATQVFWAKGYEATSMADLLKATGINKGSLYNAFGSKKALFMKALLKYYREQHKATLASLTAMDDPRAAIESFFDALIKKSILDQELKGCLLINTALDMPNQDAEVSDTIRVGLNEAETFFRSQIIIGQSRGEIPEHLDPDSVAKGLLTLVAGLRVLARGTYDEESLLAIKTQALALIS